MTPLALGITFETAEPDSIGTHLLEFHITSFSTGRPVVPHISLVQVWIRAYTAVEDLGQVDWATFEEAVLSLNPVPTVQLIVENIEGMDGAKPIFKWLLDVVPKHSILARAHSEGKLDVRFAVTYRRQEYRDFHYITSQEILSAQSEYFLNDQKVVLTPPDIFGLMVCDEDKKEEYLRDVGRTLASTGTKLIHGTVGTL